MNFDNPTVEDRQWLAFVSSYPLKQLKAKLTWSDDDVEELLLCNHEWNEDVSWWCVPVSALEEIAFDSRTPERWVNLIQRMVQHAKDNNQSTIHPDSGFEL
jgi:hypothetical protein